MPVSTEGDVTPVNEPTGFIRFTRKCKAEGNYGMAELAVSVPFTVSGDDEDAILSDVRRLCTVVQAVVLERMGLDYDIDPQTGQVNEATPYRDLLHVESQQTGDESPRSFSDLPEKPNHVDADLWADLVENRGGWFDNRAQKKSGEAKATSPDFKRKSDRKGIWLTPPKK